jgi:hypothetical protein
MLSAPQPDFYGIEVIVEVRSSMPTTPSWWQFFNAESCRQAAASVSLDFQTHPSQACVDPWLGQWAGGIAAYLLNYVGDPDRARLIVGAVALVPTGLDPDVEYYGFQLILSNARTVGTDACEGCAAGVCLTLAEIKVVQADGSFERCNVPLQSQFIGWQCARGGGTHTECDGCPTAATPSSWGQIKSLYR